MIPPMNLVADWLWRLLPGNPMVIRIVEGGSRRTRHLWVRMGYLGALIVLVLIGLLSGGGLGGEVSLTDLAKAGSSLFAVIAYGQVILVCLLAPLFMAGAIGAERANETFSILLTTPLTNLQIVLGSLFGRLFFVLALLLSGLPLFAVLLIFGGVPISSVFVAFALAALTTLMVGSVAVFLSTLRAGGRKAVFAFVISIAAYLVGAYILDVGVLRRLDATNYTTAITPLHPLLVLESSLRGANYGPPPPETLTGHGPLTRFYLARPFLAFTIITLLLSTILIAASAILLRAFGQGDSVWMYNLKRKLRIGGGGERTRPGREVWQNPVAWREASTRGKVASGILARWGFVVVGLGIALLLIVLYHTGSLPTVLDDNGQPLPAISVFRTALLATLLLEVAVITLVAIYMSAGSVSREREDGTLDLVLTTPITPRFYIWGKLQGLVRFLTLLIAVPVLTVAMVSVYAMIGYAAGWPQATFKFSSISTGGAALASEPMIMLPEAAVLLAVMLVPFVALCVAAGMNWSLKAKGVLGAVIPTIALVGGWSLVLALCGWQAAENIPFIGAIVNAFSPVTNLAMIVDPWGGAGSMWQGVEQFGADPISGRVFLVIAALAAAGGYSVVVWSLITGMVKGFDQTVRKLSGAA